MYYVKCVKLDVYCINIYIIICFGNENCWNEYDVNVS